MCRSHQNSPEHLQRGPDANAGRNAWSRDLKFLMRFRCKRRSYGTGKPFSAQHTKQQANNSLKATMTMGNVRAYNLFAISLGTSQEPIFHLETRSSTESFIILDQHLKMSTSTRERRQERVPSHLQRPSQTTTDNRTMMYGQYCLRAENSSKPQYDGSTKHGSLLGHKSAYNLFAISPGTSHEPISLSAPPRDQIFNGIFHHTGSTPQDVHKYEREKTTTCPQPPPTTISNDSDRK
ncbi:hypothetical protein PROFUN_08559 [Planoprotostelium fungivorum]|uniref:Uncharacterized protein n=1 Tax=Planoprotostelium fungivorum TaxID=1890364 RepID=A0A2P6N1R9_9EUKA|nr:hypothetical protein PROFUN_08559 [Planoprotostelium fungivorum]